MMCVNQTRIRFDHQKKTIRTKKVSFTKNVHRNYSHMIVDVEG